MTTIIGVAIILKKSLESCLVVSKPITNRLINLRLRVLRAPSSIVMHQTMTRTWMKKRISKVKFKQEQRLNQDMIYIFSQEI